MLLCFLTNHIPEITKHYPMVLVLFEKANYLHVGYKPERGGLCGGLF